MRGQSAAPPWVNPPQMNKAPKAEIMYRTPKITVTSNGVPSRIDLRSIGNANLGGASAYTIPLARMSVTGIVSHAMPKHSTHLTKQLIADRTRWLMIVCFLLTNADESAE